ncbi:hypothetical protein E2562_004428 [Oryza meyeriana var. granulata]|uniref:Uncharacterized protein n=1 Tax=Oryza meyeriana var. granulata TaxID=110450 RepID=A0A6G1CZC9_9ORYZ|nr:hypothetical protein E2562_004428 [Oryza meyeriana var. granulata]
MEFGADRGDSLGDGEAGPGGAVEVGGGEAVAGSRRGTGRRGGSAGRWRGGTGAPGARDGDGEAMEKTMEKWYRRSGQRAQNGH